MSTSELEEIDVVQPATGTLRRVVLALLALAAAAAVIWRLWPDHGRGEREQAHRVLIVGGTPTDLSAAIAEAGFEGVQKTWADAEAEVAALEQRFDLDALIGFADEHGYGFVALIFGDDYPWSPDVLGVEAPAHAGAAVISIGELARDRAPQVAFGGPPTELEYAPGIERGEALRLALYHHPDLVRLWDDPTPAQQAQQVQLGRLADSRTLLDLKNQGYAAALSAWPELPRGAIAGRWQDVQGFPVVGGAIVELRRSTLRVNERREVERVREPWTSKFVSDAALAGPDPLAHASEVSVAPLRRVELSSDRRFFMGGERETNDLRRYEVTDAGIVDLGVSTDYVTPLAISTSGRVARSTSSAILTDVGDVAIDYKSLNVLEAAWYEPERLAVAMNATTTTTTDDWRSLLLLVQPNDDPAVSPSMRVLAPEALLTDQRREPGAVGISELAATSAGLFVILSHRTPTGGEVQTVVRMRIPEHALAPVVALDPDSAMLTGELLAASVREPDDVELATLGVLPFTENLDVAPDGSFIAWRAQGSRQTIRAAPIEDGGIGAAVEIDDGSPRQLRGHAGPYFRADGRALVFVDTSATGLSEGREEDLHDDPWTFSYLRVVPLK